MGLHVQTEIINSGNILASATVSGLNLIASSLSTGGIVFPTSAGLLTQNISQLYWNNTTNRLGLGTGSNPSAKFHLDTDPGESNIAFLITHEDSGNRAMIHALNSGSGYDLRLENSYAGGSSGIGTRIYSFATYDPSGASSGLLSNISFAGWSLNGGVSGSPQTYSSIQAWAIDNTSGSTDGGLFVRTKINGTDTLMMTVKDTIESRDHNPFSDLTYNLGTASKRWNVGYFNTIFASDLSGVSTINGSSVLLGSVVDKRILFGSGTQIYNRSNLVYDYSTGRMAITGISGQTADFFQVSDFSSNELFSVGASDIVINEGGQARDFRIESDTYSNFFGLDGTNDHLVIGQTTSISALQIPGKTNVLTVAGSMSTGGVSRLRSPSSSASLQFGTRDSKYVTTSWPGRLMNRNPDFMMTAVGTSGLSITGFSRYGASFNTLAVLQDNTAPNKSAKIMRCIYPGSGSGSTGIGGFHCGENPLSVAPDDAAVSSWSKYRKGSRFATIIWAKIPSGRSIQRGSNAIGTSGNQNWMTSQAGTDNWEKYVLLTTIGESGTFSTTNFFYVDGDTSTDAYWDVASCHTVALDEDAASVDFGQLNVGLKENMVIGWGELVTTSTSYLAIDGGSLRVGTTGNPGSFLANFAGNVGPNADATYSLGSNSFQWLSVYANSGSFPALVNVTGINGIAPSSFLNTFNGSIGLNQVAYGAGSNIFGGNPNFLYTSGIRQLMMSGTTSASIPNIALHGSGDMLLLNTTTNQDSGSYVRFTEGTTYQGAYLNYDALANLFFIGVHDTANSLKSSDFEAITIRRSNGTVGINTVATSRLHVFENSSNVDSSAGLTIEQSGAGDAVVQFLLSGTQRWVAGIDNSDNDRFKISWDADLADNTPFVITTSGTISLGGGTTTPSAYVHILPTGTTTLASGDIPALRIQRAGTSNRLDFYNDAVANWIVSDDIGSNHKHLINLIVCSGSDLNRNFYVYFADNATKTVTQTERMTMRGSGVGGINLASATPQAAWEVVSPHTTIPTILARGIAAQTASLIEARNSSLNDLFHVRLSEVVINDGSVDLDTRIETNNDDNMLFVDGGNDWAVFGGASNPGSFKVAFAGHVGPTATMTYRLGSDAYRFVNIYSSGLDLSGSFKLRDVVGVLKGNDGYIEGGATTSDLPEGYNLYFTNQRAIDAVYTSGSFTPGSIIFAGTSGQLDEDAGQLHYDATNRLVGIRTNQPTAHVHVQHVNARIRLENNGSATATLSGVMFSGSPGLHLSAGGQNSSTNPYSPGIIFESTDPQLTTLNPKGLAGIVGRATETYGADNAGGMAIDFAVTPNTPGISGLNFVAMTINQNGWVGVGSGTTSPSAGLHIKPLGATDGTELLRIEGERGWSFIQRGAGGNANMHFTDLVGGKYFSIDTSVGFMRRNNTTGSDTITLMHYGSAGRTSIGTTAQTAPFVPGSTLEVYGENAVNIAHFNAGNNNSNFRYDSQNQDSFFLIDADTDSMSFGVGAVSASYAYVFQRTGNAPTNPLDIRDSGGNSLLTVTSIAVGANVSQQDRDFTVWGSGARYMIHADCGTHAVTVGGGTSTSYLLNVQPANVGSVPADYFGVRDISANEIFSVGASDIVVNEAGLDRDFRIESDTLGSNFTIDGASGTIGINVSVSQPGQILRTVSNYVDTVGNGTNFYRNINNFAITCNIASGVTDAGYRVGMWNDFYFNNSGFVGTLNQQYGMYLGAGTNTSSPSGTINTIYGLFLAVNSGTNCIHGTEWGLYQTATSNSSQNYFKGDVRIGTASNAGNFKLNVAGHVGPQTTTTYDLGSASLKWRTGYFATGDIPALTNVTGINATGISSFLNVLTAGAIRQNQVMFGSGNQTFGGSDNFAWNNTIGQLTLSGANGGFTPQLSMNGSGLMVQFQASTNQTSGSYVRWTEGANWTGTYINYDASNDRMEFGVHNAADSALSSDSGVFYISRATSRIGINKNTPTAQLHVVPFNLAITGFIIDGVASQSADLMTVRDSSANELFSIGASDLIINEAGIDRDFRIEGNNDASLFRCDAGLDVTSIGGSPTSPSKLIVYCNEPVTSVNSTQFHNSSYMYLGGTNIASGVIDSGYRRGMYVQAYPNTSSFVGTLANMTAIHIDNGSFGTNASGIVSTNYGLRIVSYNQGNATTTNLWGLYIQDINGVSKNYIQRDLRVGTTSNAGSFLANFAGHVGPQTTSTYDLGATSLKWRTGYFATGDIPALTSVTGINSTGIASFLNILTAGAIQANQVVFGSGANTFGGTNNFVWNNTINQLTVSGSTGGFTPQLSMNGSGMMILLQAAANQVSGSYIRFTEGSTWQGVYQNYDASNDRFEMGVHNASDSSLTSDSGVFYMDRATARIGINKSTPTAQLHIVPFNLSITGLLIDGVTSQSADLLHVRDVSANEWFSVGVSDVVINEAGAARTFRVETNTNANRLFLPNSESGVVINGTTSNGAALRVVANNTGEDNTRIIQLGADREWAFYQRGVGASATLALSDLTGAKQFCIETTNYFTKRNAVLNGGSGTVTFMHGGTNGLTCIGPVPQSGVPATTVPGATLQIYATASTPALIVNEGAVDSDVRMEGTTNANLFFLDASTNSISIGTSANAGSFLMNFAGSIGPQADNTYDLGSASFEWRTAYATTGNFPALTSVTGINGTGINSFLNAGGTIGGTVAAGQIAYASATDTLAGTNNFRWINTINQLVVSGDTGAGAIPNLTVGGSGNMFMLVTPSDNASGAYMRITEAQTFIGGYLTYDCVNNRFQLGTHQNNDSLTSSDLPAITIARSTANVGIGANGLSPNYQLSLGSNLNNTKIALYDDGVSPYGIGIQSSQMRFHTAGNNNRFSFYNSPAGTERFTISSTGLVGINQPSPTAALHIVPTGATCTGILLVGASSQSAPYVRVTTNASSEIFSIDNNNFTNISGHPVGAFCQMRSSGVTNCNQASRTLMTEWVTAPEVNTNTNVFTFVTSGVKVLQAGKYKVSISMYATGASAQDMVVGFRLNQMIPATTAQSGICVMSMPANNPNGWNEASCSMTKVLTCAANDVIGCTYERLAGTGNLAITSGDSFLVVERLLG